MTAQPEKVDDTQINPETDVIDSPARRISKTSLEHQSHGAERTMKPQLGDTILNRYTLVSSLREEPGIQA